MKKATLDIITALKPISADYLSRSKLVICSLLTAIIIYNPQHLWAQQQNDLRQEKLSTVVAPVDLTASFMSMFKGLAICILILLAVIWLLKKFKSPIVTGQGRKLKILERLPVTARSSLLLVEVNQKQILVGVGSDPISLVSDFVQADSMEELRVSLDNPASVNDSEKIIQSGDKQ